MQKSCKNGKDWHEIFYGVDNEQKKTIPQAGWFLSHIVF